MHQGINVPVPGLSNASKRQPHQHYCWRWRMLGTCVSFLFCYFFLVLLFSFVSFLVSFLPFLILAPFFSSSLSLLLTVVSQIRGHTAAASHPHPSPPPSPLRQFYCAKTRALSSLLPPARGNTAPAPESLRRSVPLPAQANSLRRTPRSKQATAHECTEPFRAQLPNGAPTKQASFWLRLYRVSARAPGLF